MADLMWLNIKITESRDEKDKCFLYCMPNDVTKLFVNKGFYLDFEYKDIEAAMLKRDNPRELLKITPLSPNLRFVVDVRTDSYVGPGKRHSKNIASVHICFPFIQWASNYEPTEEELSYTSLQGFIKTISVQVISAAQNFQGRPAAFFCLKYETEHIWTSKSWESDPLILFPFYPINISRTQRNLFGQQYVISSGKYKQTTYIVASPLMKPRSSTDPTDKFLEMVLEQEPRFQYFENLLQNEGRSWKDAEMLCQAIGGHLPHFTDRNALENFLFFMDVANPVPLFAIYIGLLSKVANYYWPIFGQYCFQTCRFIYLFIYLFIYFLFFCLFVCLFVCRR